MSDENETFDEEENLIAIIGMAGRFPKANSVTEFWDNLVEEKECIQTFTEAELVMAGVDLAMVRNPKYVKAAATLENIDMFDAEFFGINPAEAALLDPQQRLFLETVWHALEDAACDPERFDGRIGMYAGCALSSYLIQNLLTNPEETQKLGATQAHMSNDKDFLPTRASYLFNLTGPSVSVGTACSTSLVSIHQAIQSLLNFESDLALAGGVSIRANQVEGHVYQESGILSPDGHCRPFDAKAQGTIVGSGVGVVALKRLSEAIENRDPIYAVVRGSAINNDGQIKVGYTAPSLSGQAEVITEAHAVAGIDASEVGYIEAHGTGTVLGDPIEVAALGQAFSASESEEDFNCAIGSLKSNMGHLDSAAGVAGFIKASLCVNKGKVPASLHYQQPNPKINFDSTPFFVNASTKSWGELPGVNQERRIAGVSSFGIGGTNAHVIVEQPPESEGGTGSDESPQMIVLSATSNDALQAMKENVATHLQTSDDALQNIAFTLQEGRKSFAKRYAVNVLNRNHAIQILSDKTSGVLGTALEDPKVVFLFSGQGSQYVGMAKTLYAQSETFREHFDSCCVQVKNECDIDLNLIIHNLEDAETINETRYAQPALFSVEYALAKTLECWGITPQAMLGHSIGEYVAATLAGVFSLSDALRVVCHRGRLMQSCQPGSMLSAELPQEEVDKWIGGNISLAAQNSRRHCVFSGPDGDIQQLSANLEKNGIQSKLLKTSHAFHSHMMEPILEEFGNVLESVALKEPQAAFISNVTGEWIATDQAISRNYWVSQLRSAVRFSDGVETISQQIENPVWLEVGPGRALTSLVRAHLSTQGGDRKKDLVTAINVLPSATSNDSNEGSDSFVESLARLWTCGVEVSWEHWHKGAELNRVHLPNYPFQRKSFWVKPGEGMAQNHLPILPEEKWMLVPSWKRSVSLAHSPSREGKHVVVMSSEAQDQNNFSGAVIEALLAHGDKVTEVGPGEAFEKVSDNKFQINFSQSEDYLCLFESIEDPIDHVLHLCSVGEAQDGIESAIASSFSSPLYTLQAIKRENFSDNARLIFVSENAQNIFGDEIPDSAKAALTGPTLVGRIECNFVDVQWVDFDGDAQTPTKVENLIREMDQASHSDEVGYRRGIRWEKSFSPLDSMGIANDPGVLKEKGTYLITGGLGGMGLSFAELLAENYSANVILMGRKGFPNNAPWDQEEGGEEIARLVSRLKGIQEKASSLTYFQCDVADIESLKKVVSEVRAQHGGINGVIHAAGIPGGGLLQLKEKEAVDAVMRPKVQGSLALIDVLEDEESLDFLVFCSSLSAHVGVLGQIDYSSANAFQDALAQSTQFKNGAKVISIDWDGWRESGMAVDNHNPLADESGLEIGLNDAEGKRALVRALASGLNHVMVSTIDWEKRCKQIRDHHDSAKRKELENMQGGERPDLSSVYVEPSNEIEETLANILSELLFIRPVGVLDDFFELGGHSLIAVNFCSRASEKLQVEITVAEFFETPTVSAIAEKVAAKKLELMDDSEVLDMLDEIDSLSDEDIQNLLQE